MKRSKIIGLGLILCLLLSTTLCIGIFDSGTVFASAESGKSMDAYDVDRMSQELFGNVRIEGKEFLYNLDDSPDFIHVSFAGTGYAVFAAESLELMEYSPQGSLPFKNGQSQRYYSGPQNYYTKSAGQFVNAISGTTLSISTTEAKSHSQRIRQAISVSAKETNVSTDEEQIVQQFNGADHKRSSVLKNSNKFDENNFIQGTNTFNVQYINNSQYFLADPTFGWNTHGTCGSVAAQLLLSYNNYYNDRRIIPPQHLNGGWNNSLNNNDVHARANYDWPNQNPNVVTNPTTRNSWTTGSNDDYNEAIITAIEPDALNCVCTRTITDIVIASGTATITITVIVTQPDGTSTTTTNTTTRPANAGEISSWNSETDHTHNGSSHNQQRTGLNSLLNARIPGGYTINHDSKGWFFGWSPISSTPIKNEINNHRPLIISTSSNLGGADHAMVAYGYADYTYPTAQGGGTYSGYIVHFGWNSSENNVWVNSSWCDGYIALQINHTHTYNIDTGINHDGNTTREVRCACGHRTTESLFNVTGT